MSKLISFNTENEQVIISSMCHSIGIRKRLSHEVSSDHFVGSKHQVLFKALKTMALNNDEFNEDTLNQYADGDFGGFKYLRKLLEAYPGSNPNIDIHIRVLLLDSAKIKAQKNELQRLQEAFDDPQINPENVIRLLDTMKQRFSNVTNQNVVRFGDTLKKEYMKDLKVRTEDGSFVGSELPELDENLAEGFALRKCSVIAARPSMGKSTLISIMSRRQVHANRSVCLVPIESGSISILDAMVADTANIDLYTLIRNPKNIDIVDKRKIMKCLDSILSNKLLHIIDDPTLTLDRLGGILSDNNYGICYIDLFERLADISIRPDAISEKLRTVQRIAKETNTHMSLIHQIHRLNTKDRDKKSTRPTMEMLKNSGGYEEIADLIVLLHREKYYNAELNEDIIELIIAKQRRGVRDKTVGYDFDGSHARLSKGYKDYKPKDTRKMDDW